MNDHQALGDEQAFVVVERWMEGLTVVQVSDFVDGDGQQWRQITLSSGTIVQTLFSAPWLIVEAQ